MPGSIIRQFREMRNYSQKYVAAKMGISQNAYSKIENNITQLNVEHLKQLSVILEVSALDLLRDEFEIRKPLHIKKGGSNINDVIATMIHIRKKLDAKKKINHNFYPLVQTLLHAVDNIIDEIE